MRVLIAILFAVIACAAAAAGPDARPDGIAQACDGSVLDHDREFDTGSRIALHGLTLVQTENLVTLGKVWGFLKYHHPAITGGQHHWDYDLLRIMPQILAAPDRDAANGVLLQWIAGLGPVAACQACASLNTQQLYLRPALGWIKDSARLGPALSAGLEWIYINRSSRIAQFYLTKDTYIGNPNFEHESGYRTIVFPDAGFQLLALFRFWNVIEYWSPYRDVIGNDWDSVLRQSIAPLALAPNRSGYEVEMMAVIARVHDSHSNLWSSLKRRPPQGECHLPVTLRFIERHAVVSGYRDAVAAPPSGLKIGDSIEALDGVAIDRLVERWTPYYGASNQSARLRDIATDMTRGACDAKVRVRLRRGETEQELPVVRSRVNPAPFAHDRDGLTFQRLADDIAYLKLSSIKAADIPRYMELLSDVKGLIIDIRNYPSEFVVLALGRHLIEKDTDFVRFTEGDVANPGALHWAGKETLQPGAPHFAGRVVILVDEISQSQAEYTAMALRSAPGAKVLGSQTAGADGNFSPIALPGGLGTGISGIGIFYPDKRPTQRIGIIPDIEVRPTIDGIRGGRDELLEAAIAEIRRDRAKPAASPSSSASRVL